MFVDLRKLLISPQDGYAECGAADDWLSSTILPQATAGTLKTLLTQPVQK